MDIKLNKINLSKITYNNELNNSKLEFNISGNNINDIVMNSLRRVAFESVPIFAFNEFNFDKNTSIYHNTKLKLRLENMPVWGIKNKVDYINIIDKHKELEKIEENDNDANIDINNELDYSSLNQLTMYVSCKNKSNEVISVTTQHAKFYYEQKQIDNPYKDECLLLKLQPNQEISFSTITNIGVEETDTKYSSVSIIRYKQNNDNDFDFLLKSRGQITEQRILQVVIINIKRKLNNFLKVFIENIKKDFDVKEKEGLLIVHNEDHTMGNLICHGMQHHTKIKFAGYNLPHPLAKIVHFHYELKEDGNIEKIMNDVVEYYLELFDNIDKLFKKNLN